MGLPMPLSIADDVVMFVAADVVAVGAAAKAAPDSPNNNTNTRTRRIDVDKDCPRCE